MRPVCCWPLPPENYLLFKVTCHKKEDRVQRENSHTNRKCASGDHPWYYLRRSCFNLIENMEGGLIGSFGWLSSCLQTIKLVSESIHQNSCTPLVRYELPTKAPRVLDETCLKNFGLTFVLSISIILLYIMSKVSTKFKNGSCDKEISLCKAGSVFKSCPWALMVLRGQSRQKVALRLRIWTVWVCILSGMRNN